MLSFPFIMSYITILALVIIMGVNNNKIINKYKKFFKLDNGLLG